MTDIVARAEELARRAHSGQVDKQGRDYADHHLTQVASLLEPFGPEAVAAGWLHDVIEDTTITLDDLHGRFPTPVVDAVDAVTRRPCEDYDALIYRAARNPLGAIVKLMDGWVNLTGLDGIEDEATRERLRKKYMDARYVLLGVCGLGACRDYGEDR